MAYTTFTINAGHSAKAPGASGNGYKEHEVARQIKDKLITGIKAVGLKAVDTTSDAANKSAVLVEQAKKCNAIAKKGRLDVSIHLNAGGGKGTEVLYYTENKLSAEISKAVADAGGFTNRGAKLRKDLYFLKHTDASAILIEVCFIDNKDDMKKLFTNMDKVINAIVKALTGKEIPNKQNAASKPATKPAAKPKEPAKQNGKLHRVQVGAFTDPKNAEKLVKELEKKGYKPVIVKE